MTLQAINLKISVLGRLDSWGIARFSIICIPQKGLLYWKYKGVGAMKITLIFIILLLEGFIINPINVFTQTPSMRSLRCHQLATMPNLAHTMECVSILWRQRRPCPMVPIVCFQSTEQNQPVKAKARLDTELTLAVSATGGAGHWPICSMKFLFPTKRNASPQAEIERQNAIKRQQEEEQKKRRPGKRAIRPGSICKT